MPPVRPAHVATPHGEVALVEQAAADAGDEGRVVVFLHGNSMCKEVFRGQFNAGLDRFGRLLALDLPGHGTSQDAPDPDTGYTLPGYAETVATVLEARGARSAVLVGWSLGGHVALELLGSLPSGLVEGVFLQGTPPVAVEPAAMAEAFLPHPHLGLAFQASLAEAEMEAFAATALGAEPPPFVLAAVRRADGRARARLGASIAEGLGLNGRAVAEHAPIPLALVLGSAEPFVNPAYLDALHLPTLWEGRIPVLEGAGHAPFWNAPREHNALLATFLQGVRASGMN